MNHGATEPPIPNSYWVETPYLLAGEYPGSHRADEAADRLAAFLNAGIENFIDLTEPGELEPYEPVLRELASARGVVVTWARRPIRDLGIPTRKVMADLLDTIDGFVATRRGVYVHCWGGVGRTGTVVGCYLVRHGMRGPAALERLDTWWQALPKRRLHPRSPETDQQVQYILSWDGRG